jgi:multisubunit Na+/H+ antiporter MnhG subunit|tara:strand:- start:252 stop:554 length:303 start_codon:yes stop_codon:yes gene_type:complete
MNVNQIMILTGVSAAILMAIGLFYNSLPKGNLDAQMLNYFHVVGGSAVVILVWLGFIFIADLYMRMNSLEKKVDTYQKQFHEDIMKRYIDVEEKCGKKLI